MAVTYRKAPVTYIAIDPHLLQSGQMADQMVSSSKRGSKIFVKTMPKRHNKKSIPHFSSGKSAHRSSHQLAGAKNKPKQSDKNGQRERRKSIQEKDLRERHSHVQLSEMNHDERTNVSKILCDLKDRSSGLTDETQRETRQKNNRIGRSNKMKEDNLKLSRRRSRNGRVNQYESDSEGTNNRGRSRYRFTEKQLIPHSSSCSRSRSLSLTKAHTNESCRSRSLSFQKYADEYYAQEYDCWTMIKQRNSAPPPQRLRGRQIAAEKLPEYKKDGKKSNNKLPVPEKKEIKRYATNRRPSRGRSLELHSRRDRSLSLDKLENEDANDKRRQGRRSREKSLEEYSRRGRSRSLEKLKNDDAKERLQHCRSTPPRPLPSAKLFVYRPKKISWFFGKMRKKPLPQGSGAGRGGKKSPTSAARKATAVKSKQNKKVSTNTKGKVGRRKEKGSKNKNTGKMKRILAPKFIVSSELQVRPSLPTKSIQQSLVRNQKISSQSLVQAFNNKMKNKIGTSSTNTKRNNSCAGRSTITTVSSSTS